MKFICDADILSMLAKIDKVDLLRELSKETLLSAEEVKEELLVSKDHGYDYVDEIFERVEFLDLKKKEREEYNNILKREKRLNPGEIQIIVLAKK